MHSLPLREGVGLAKGRAGRHLRFGRREVGEFEPAPARLRFVMWPSFPKFDRLAPPHVGRQPIDFLLRGGMGGGLPIRPTGSDEEVKLTNLYASLDREPVVLAVGKVDRV